MKALEQLRNPHEWECNNSSSMIICAIIGFTNVKLFIRETLITWFHGLSYDNPSIVALPKNKGKCRFRRRLLLWFN